jgi:hypothetical protein
VINCNLFGSAINLNNVFNCFYFSYSFLPFFEKRIIKIKTIKNIVAIDGTLKYVTMTDTTGCDPQKWKKKLLYKLLRYQIKHLLDSAEGVCFIELIKHYESEFPSELRNFRIHEIIGCGASNQTLTALTVPSTSNLIHFLHIHTYMQSSCSISLVSS